VSRFKLFQSRLAAVRKHDLFKDQDQFTLESIMEVLNRDLAISDLFGLGEAEKYLEVMANQDDSVITYDGGVIVSRFPFSHVLLLKRLTCMFVLLTVLLISISLSRVSIWFFKGSFNNCSFPSFSFGVLYAVSTLCTCCSVIHFALYISSHSRPSLPRSSREIENGNRISFRAFQRQHEVHAEKARTTGVMVSRELGYRCERRFG